ncbi:uncharacterized protein LOC111880197 [Lactuca sativa]|uniref:uncharacterized protein LOC111880197 n=1 Tax=Lactuca sativa TaxID=4236 RepID=UPI000CD9A8F0|nr:uncharacterized protein LOC111880197 [Lactuca sativa]
MNHLTLRLMYLSLFFIGSSDNPNFVLVSNVFTGVGFNSTKRSMVISLPAKNKLGFVDGTIAPPLSTSSTYSNWFRANSMVISWLLNSVTKTIADSLLFLPTAKEIWQELHQRFEQFASALTYQMQQQSYSLSQGADDFSSYFTKFTKLWDEIRMIQSVPNCTCGPSIAINKFFEEQRLIQLLMGLDESYKIIHEERQRGINHPSTLSNDAIAMQISSDSSRKLLTCNHCKKSGHTKAQCYRLNGFPSNCKFTENKKDDVKPTVQNVISNDSPPISQEQYN